MKDVVIVSAVRTPVGKFQGALSHLSAVELGALVVREAVRRAGIAPESVDECVMGCVLPAGLGQNPARQAALLGGLADSVSALTINMVCGSGLQAVSLAAQSIMTGASEIVVAGGMESMSNAPYLLPNARKGFRMGDVALVDSMIRDGLWCACDDQHMGMTGELVADKYSITREQQDAYAVESHRRAAAAWNEGHFDAEVMSVAVPSAKKGNPATEVLMDESIRPDASLQTLAQRLSLLGALNSLSQLTLKATIPGVPDFYQGTEFWDLSLVDPDNRRPVDFAERARVLATMETPDWQSLAREWSNGHLKLAWTRRLLRLRTELADVFANGGYEPLEVSGPHRDHVIAFARRRGRDAAIVVVAKSFAAFTQAGRSWPKGDDFDATLDIGGYSVQGFAAAHAAQLRLSDLFRDLPVAVLQARFVGALKPARARPS